MGCTLAVMAAVLLFFLSALTRLEQDRRTVQKERLFAALQRTAAACYAAEGAYPPDLAYMQKHYGLRFDETRYMVIYEVFASNLMPDITVLEKKDEK